MENKPKQSFLKSAWIPGVLIVIIMVTIILNQTGYITLPHLTIPYFENSTDVPISTVKPKSTPKTLPPAKVFDVKISSYSCNWTVQTDKYGNKSDSIRVIAKGTAQGPVGARVELPILDWSTDKFDCGAWTYHAGALIAVGSTCVRKEGQPETTNWSVDTDNQTVIKSYWNNNQSYSAKIYLNNDIYPKKTDNKNTMCQ